ncbi:MAG: hypothetical protein Q8K78_18210 [Planctomycetaceae bacterium]|nr:hypothetical protein [Planctomycetaceae bacterium]
MNDTDSIPGGKMPREQYTITLETLPTDPRPGIIRMRSALKLLLRACGLRCVTCRAGDGSAVQHD